MAFIFTNSQLEDTIGEKILMYNRTKKDKISGDILNKKKDEFHILG